MLLFGLAATAASFQIAPDPDGGWGARIFPLVGSLAVVMCGAVECFARPTQARTPEHQATLRVIALLIVSIAYIWLIGRFGYLLSTAVAAPLALWLFGIRKRIGLAAAAILCPAIYHLLFFEALGVFPPLGDWFDLLDVFAG